MKVKHYNKFWDIEFFTFARNKAAKKAHNLLLASVRNKEEHEATKQALDDSFIDILNSAC